MPHGFLVECGPVRLPRLPGGNATEREKGTQTQRKDERAHSGGKIPLMNPKMNNRQPN